ncbi:RNA polymerase sigma factor [Occallatibacter savannae]|uniref:RNA polymerase sigma factor n=1 Tax=Occallatibacter savannae TaxID=1002691 RepID=UPI000D69050F|nr:RNA polymerase sigma factor [Occallatibacter savannae]
MHDDAQLVASAQDGDQKAFAELVRRYRDRVFRLAVSILGREFIPEAEDVAQEVFLKIHHSLKTFRGEAQFGSWIYRVTFNHAVNVKERARFRRPHEDDTALHRLAGSGPGLEKQMESAQRDKALEECIETLPELYQSALRQYYWFGSAVGEIAESLGVPENTVKSYLHRARKMLHGMLKERGLSCD